MSVAFDDSAHYQFTGAAVTDQLDTNKLYGFADCKSLDVLENSARFGWRDNNGQLEIMTFTHRNGVFYPAFLTAIDTNRPYNASITLSDDKQYYIYDFNGVTSQVLRGCNDSYIWGYHSYPYFGGQQVAPHGVTIRVDVGDEAGPAYVELPYPNPAMNGNFKLNVKAYADFNFFIKLYDMLGKLVWVSDRTNFKTDQQTVVSYSINGRFAAGMYTAVPITELIDGTELRAGITNQSKSDSFKVILTR